MVLERHRFLAGGDIAVLRDRMLRWGRRMRRGFPWRSEVEPSRILIAEILLQRSRGKTVANVYEALFARWPTLEALASAREEEVAEVIRPLGLVRRAGTLKALAGEVLRRGGVPDDPEELMELPGVGRYAANATAAVAFGKRVPTVDGVTARVYRRYFGLPSDRPPASDPELWAVVEQVTPGARVREWNWAVLDLAATICLPKVPRCGECPLADQCVHANRSRLSVGGARLPDG